MATQSTQCTSTQYLLTPSEETPDGTRYKIAVVSDMDVDSKHSQEAGAWVSILKYVTLTISAAQDRVHVDMEHDTPVVLTSTIAEKGRGMELSELRVFNGKLYTIDDRTGYVYEIKDGKVEPWIKLIDGDGTGNKGFKGEWMTEKDGLLYVGSLGKEWTNDEGVVLNTDQQWVKVISPSGEVQHLNWQDKYNALRAKAGYSLPGYIIHESGVWSSVHKKWFFLPRRASTEPYDPEKDELRATNLMFIVDEDFKDIQISRIGELNPARGFSSFKFVPGTNHTVIVALKSEEVGEKKATFILVFTIDGNIICQEQLVGNKKYEGVEFV